MSRHAFPLLLISVSPRARAAFAWLGPRARAAFAWPGPRARCKVAGRPACPERRPVRAWPGKPVRALALLALLGACGSDPSADGPDAQPGQADGGASDGGPGGSPVAHVPAEGAFAGTGRLILQDGAVIDTDSLTVNGQGYARIPGAAIVFDTSPQVAGGPDLAVLHVGDFGVESGTVTVRGARPLVIIAGLEIRLAGMLDASASAQTPGPGGFDPAAGPSPGGDGQHAGDFQDGGGGGGGHGSPGGEGGSATCASIDDCSEGGAGGAPYDISGPSVLQGGSGGGAGSIVSDNAECVPSRGGAGGGAVQLTALMRVRIEAAGGVHVGGGGGQAGSPDVLCGENGGGCGGGAGGAIVLQAPDVAHRGVLAANGGGGGAGASVSEQNLGADALASDQPAPGGVRVNEFGHPGGCGDALTGASCVREGTDGEGNAGGGGGGAGRIVVITTPTGYDGIDGVTSPMVVVRAE
jgi:hypothetical protein